MGEQQIFYNILSYHSLWTVIDPSFVKLVIVERWRTAIGRYVAKDFEFAESFSNRLIQILYFYWMTNFSELHQELFKTGKGQSRRF
jgi:hypothetical protein